MWDEGVLAVGQACRTPSRMMTNASCLRNHDAYRLPKNKHPQNSSDLITVILASPRRRASSRRTRDKTPTVTRRVAKKPLQNRLRHIALEIFAFSFGLVALQHRIDSAVNPSGRRVMPRLNHKKARTGCQRCKARKVKCDELKPKCSACQRHNVACDYVDPPPRKDNNANNGSQQQLPLSTPSQDGGYAIGMPQQDGLDPRLEIRLMHEWTAYTCSSFSNAIEFWRFQAPLFAIEHRMVLDAMFGLAALHFSRQSPSQWYPMDGRMVPIRDPIYRSAFAARDLSDHWKETEDQVDSVNALRNANDAAYIGAKRSQEMLANSRFYFDRAVDGHYKCLHSLTKDNVEAAYLTSILISYYSLFTLSEDESNSTLPTLDPLTWLRISSGTAYLLDVWKTLQGEEYLQSIGAYFGNTRLSEEDALYESDQGRPFQNLLTFAEEYETPSPEDKDAYRKCIASLALIYRSISQGNEDPLINCKRLVALPSRVPKRFNELVEARAPRALVALAYTFALMKLISDKVPWFQGLAERQMPKIQQQIPPAWNELMAWPNKVAEGKFDPSSEDADIREFLSL